jgi:hypothetical protein
MGHQIFIFLTVVGFNEVIEFVLQLALLVILVIELVKCIRYVVKR